MTTNDPDHCCVALASAAGGEREHDADAIKRRSATASAIDD